MEPDVERSAVKRVAIVQSSYIPWKGYFDLINSVDEFILFEDMQYTRRDWRNRNRIKTPSGVQWLTVPVKVKGRYFQRIRDTEVSDASWVETHLRSLMHSYGKAPFFREYWPPVRDAYEGARTMALLSEVNHRLITAICDVLGIGTTLSWSMDYPLVEGKTERLVELCKVTGGGEYISGPSARDYIDESLFVRAGVGLRYMDYSGYPEYAQLHPPFDHFVTILDLLFHTGPDARRYMKSF